jgi:predicted DsbA family dithiol-disulfide isomerase
VHSVAAHCPGGTGARRSGRIVAWQELLRERPTESVPARNPYPARVPDPAPLQLTVFYDVHCPYSDRVLAWLADLGREAVAAHYRTFPLEQVNTDPSAKDWRIWEQPLDYEHYQGRPERRALAAFLAILLAERVAPVEAVDRFRLLVSRARHGLGRDVTERSFLLELAGEAGVDARALNRLLDDDAAQAWARQRIADDWADARAEYEIFGVPTLRLYGVPPFYLRLERVPRGEDARELLESIRGFARRLPQVVEIKVPERTRVQAPVA